MINHYLCVPSGIEFGNASMVKRIILQSWASAASDVIKHDNLKTVNFG
jgi:hypothetical protein